MEKDTKKYAQRGVSSSKSEVHNATKKLDKGLFPNAFCKVLPDPRDPEYCMSVHVDTAGTKPILTYVHWKETGDVSRFRDIVIDALVMNFDDLACAGFVDNFVVSSNIARNKFNITGECINQLINGTQDYLHYLSGLGFRIEHAGGETADVGDLIRTLDVGFTIYSSTKKEEVVDINIKAGDQVLGFPSHGTCSYDPRPNSGMGSNGLTSARHDILSPKYREKYPEAYDRESLERSKEPYHTYTEDIVYCGKYDITSPEAQLLMDPTRTYLPFLKALKDEDIMRHISGIIHNTGGAHGKVLNFVDGVSINKTFYKSLPPVFTLLQKESNVSWKEMFQVYNMGVRLEIYAQPDILKRIGDIGVDFGLPSAMFGEVTSSEKTQVIINHDDLTGKSIVLQK